jgi:hypothetical protein
MSDLTEKVGELAGDDQLSLTLWDPNVSYKKGDVVVYFKEESKQKSVEQGLREFVFILVSLKNNNDSIPNYDIVDHVPVFTKSDWQVLNPLSYLLQNLNEMRDVVLAVFDELLAKHVEDEHGFIGSDDIANNLVKKDYSNLQTPWTNGKYSLVMSTEEIDEVGWKGRKTKSSNGIMEYNIRYGFEMAANSQSADYQIQDKRYYYQKSPIWDESDNTIFSQKYLEQDMFSVALNAASGGTTFNNLRYGTNIFARKIDFPEGEEFINDEYCVFFDTYGPGSFVFGYDKFDLESKTKPTYDTVVSMPMLMNKTAKGFVVILPIHTYFNSMKKFNIGVPWKNEFTMQVIGRYR